jgi:hypothetical protein
MWQILSQALAQEAECVVTAADVAHRGGEQATGGSAGAATAAAAVGQPTPASVSILSSPRVYEAMRLNDTLALQMVSLVIYTVKLSKKELNKHRQLPLQLMRDTFLMLLAAAVQPAAAQGGVRCRTSALAALKLLCDWWQKDSVTWDPGKWLSAVITDGNLLPHELALVCNQVALILGISSPWWKQPTPLPEDVAMIGFAPLVDTGVPLTRSQGGSGRMQQQQEEEEDEKGLQHQGMTVEQANGLRLRRLMGFVSYLMENLEETWKVRQTLREGVVWWESVARKRAPLDMRTSPPLLGTPTHAVRAAVTAAPNTSEPLVPPSASAASRPPTTSASPSPAKMAKFSVDTPEQGDADQDADDEVLVYNHTHAEQARASLFVSTPAAAAADLAGPPPPLVATSHTIAIPAPLPPLPPLLSPDQEFALGFLAAERALRQVGGEAKAR